jgi:hypothetical protein
LPPVNVLVTARDSHYTGPVTAAGLCTPVGAVWRRGPVLVSLAPAGGNLVGVVGAEKSLGRNFTSSFTASLIGIE